MQKKSKITVTEMPFFCQFSYKEYAKDSTIKTLIMEDFDKTNGQIKQVGESLLAPKASTKGRPQN